MAASGFSFTKAGSKSASKTERWDAPKNLDRLGRGELRVGDEVYEKSKALRTGARGTVNGGKIIGEGRVGGKRGFDAWKVQRYGRGGTFFIPKGSAVAAGVAWAKAG